MQPRRQWVAVSSGGALSLHRLRRGLVAWALCSQPLWLAQPYLLDCRGLLGLRCLGRFGGVRRRKLAPAATSTHQCNRPGLHVRWLLFKGANTAQGTSRPARRAGRTSQFGGRAPAPARSTGSWRGRAAPPPMADGAHAWPAPAATHVGAASSTSANVQGKRLQDPDDLIRDGCSTCGCSPARGPPFPPAQCCRVAGTR